MLLAALLFVALVYVGFGQRIKRYFVANTVLRSPSPRDEDFADCAAHTRDLIGFLERCWNTGKVPHRQLVISLLRDRAGSNLTWSAGAEKLVVAGAVDPDLSVRELALATLQLRSDPRLADCAYAQLNDPDPSVRQLGLNYLRGLDAKTGIPAVAPLLDDPDLEIAAGAEGALMRWTGEDFGVRLRDAVPSSASGDASDNAAKDRVRNGIVQRKQWWQVHAKEFSGAPLELMAVPKPESDDVKVEDFLLPDLNGRSVHLSDFSGKTVLLNFWATWCAACREEIPDLISLHNKLGDSVVILGIALDGAVGENARIEAGQRKVASVVKTQGITYPILLDPEASVARRFNGGELPMNIIIDSKGLLRRRFLGKRSPDVYKAMIAAAEIRTAK